MVCPVGSAVEEDVFCHTLKTSGNRAATPGRSGLQPEADAGHSFMSCAGQGYSK